MVVGRGDIWLVNLDPTVGSEIKKSQPCVVISPQEMHGHLRTVIIAPMTTGSGPAPYRIELEHSGKSGFILLDQIRSVDKSRLVRHFGALDSKTLERTLATLQEVFVP